MPEEDQILSILAGLGSEFEPTIAVLTSKIESYNIQTASALLLASENRTLQQLAVNESPMSANIAFHPKKNWHNTSGNQFSSKIGRGQNYYGGRGWDRGRVPLNKITCQLCGKNGHTVHRCYHRFDSSFSEFNNSAANSRQPSGLNNNSSPTFQVACKP